MATQDNSGSPEYDIYSNAFRIKIKIKIKEYKTEIDKLKKKKIAFGHIFAA